MITYCVPSYLYDTMYANTMSQAAAKQTFGECAAGKNQSVVSTKEKEHEKIVRYVSISWNIMLQL